MSQKGIAVTFLQQFKMFSANEKTKNEFVYEIALNKKRLFFFCLMSVKVQAEQMCGINRCLFLKNQTYVVKHDKC